ncbi:cell division protein FtsQ/DivIB [Arthrobacter sp. NPDC057259]|uniref:cell division protein FtsQ/DivIB n=1 Tax=Arthrobacter sp. NPDC057259 TaxID=3346073 RepID=UPI00364567C3
MPSSRRPGYPPAPGSSNQRSSTQGSPNQGSSGRDGAPASRTGVISATKSDQGPGTSASPAPAPAPGKVLAFPEPKARRRRRIVLGTIAVVAVLIAGVIAAAVYSPWLAVRTVTVQGTRMLSQDQIQAALAPLQGKPLPQVSDRDVTALLQPLVQVKSVTSQARPPSTLQVTIVERVPVALVKQGEAFQLVDPDGVPLGTAPDAAAVKLPVIDGGGGALPQDLFHAITGVLGALPPDILARLSDASAKSVDAVELKLVDGQTIVWGNAGEKDLKARVLAALLKAPADPKNPVKVYDVSVPRHPVTR